MQAWAIHRPEKKPHYTTHPSFTPGAHSNRALFEEEVTTKGGNKKTNISLKSLNNITKRVRPRLQANEVGPPHVVSLETERQSRRYKRAEHPLIFCINRKHGHDQICRYIIFIRCFQYAFSIHYYFFQISKKCVIHGIST